MNALLLVGRVKTYEKNLLHLLKDCQNDIFVSINGILDDYHQEFIDKVKPRAIVFEEFKCPSKLLDYKNIREEYKNNTGIYKFVSHYYNLKKAFKLLKNSGNKYKNILLFRADIESKNFPNLFLDIPKGSLMNPDKVYDAEWINNEVIYGCQETMEIYCNIYDYLEWYVDRNFLLHPEIIATDYLKQNKIEIIKFKYDYQLDLNRYG